MRTLAVVPSRYEPQRLAKLVARIAPECDVLVLDNGHERLPAMRATVLDARGDGLYAMWNRGADWARDHGYKYVAVLNDDVEIGRGVIRRLTDGLASATMVGAAYPFTGAEPLLHRNPDGPYEMTGYCFAFPASLPIRFDESWSWWVGDVAFNRDVLQAGYGVLRVPDCAISHTSDAERDGWARRPELRALAEADAARWAAMLEAVAV